MTVVAGPPERTAEHIARSLMPGDGVICFDEFAGRFPGCQIQRMGPAGDKSAQARHIFDALRAFDHTEVPRIWAQCPDPSGLGLAINNRLNKAAGFNIVEVK